MGLGSVELLMDIEDAFGIDISEQDAVRIRTVGDLVATVERPVREKVALKTIPSPSCDPAAAVRHAVADATGRDEGAVGSDIKLGKLVPRREWIATRDRIVAALNRQGYVPLYRELSRRWTVGQLMEVMFTPDDVRGRVIGFISHVTGVPQKKIAMESRLVQDLGLD